MQADMTKIDDKIADPIRYTEKALIDPIGVDEDTSVADAQLA
jgi:hypothetical protein